MWDWGDGMAWEAQHPTPEAVEHLQTTRIARRCVAMRRSRCRRSSSSANNPAAAMPSTTLSVFAKHMASPPPSSLPPFTQSLCQKRRRYPPIDGTSTCLTVSRTSLPRTTVKGHWGQEGGDGGSRNLTREPKKEEPAKVIIPKDEKYRLRYGVAKNRIKAS